MDLSRPRNPRDKKNGRRIVAVSGLDHHRKLRQPAPTQIASAPSFAQPWPVFVNKVKVEPLDEEEVDCIGLDERDVASCLDQIKQPEQPAEEDTTNRSDQHVVPHKMFDTDGNLLSIPVAIKMADIDSDSDSGGEFHQSLVARIESDFREPPATTEPRRKAGTYQCHVCSKVFRYASHLDRHVRIHAGEKPHKCPQCERAFGSDYDFRRHFRVHTGQKLYQCNDCPETFDHAKHLKKHVLSTHIGDTPYRCQVCEKTFSEASNLKVHLRIHTGDKPHKCNVCTKAFGRSNDLRRHLRIHANENKNKCPFCEMKFGSAALLERHVPVHSPENQVKINNFQIATGTSRQNSSYQTETAETGYQSVVANEPDVGQVEADQTASTLQLEEEDTVEEDDPDSSMDPSTRRIRTNAKSLHKCPVCPKSFDAASKLRRHVCTHTGETSYKCDVCLKTFIEASKLKRHLLVHSERRRFYSDRRISEGAKPFKCPVCLKEFRLADKLQFHARIHTGEKPYKCKEVACQKAFRKQDDLRRHIRVHTGEKPYKCPVCDKAFSQPGILNNHARTHK